MDMVEMMLQHLHDFSEPYAHDQGFHFHPPEDHFYANNNNNIRNTMPLADLIDNNNPPTSMPCWSSSTISFSNNNNPTVLQQQPTTTCEGDNKKNSMAVMREMIFRIAAMQPIHIDPESVKAPKRRNVKISKDPQSVAARHRRERISERIRILQRLVPGGTKMDTASMLDEAIHYVKFLKTQVQSLEQRASSATQIEIGFPVRSAPTPYFPHMEMHHRYD